jgi:hypothetical protein
MAVKSSKRGRKGLHPDGSDVVVLRIEPNLLSKIERLAGKHRQDRSKEIRAALRFWVGLYQQDTLHVGKLTGLIEMLVHDIEKRTGKRWIDDPLTGTAVREQVERLIFHLAPTPSQPITVPEAINNVVTFLIMRYENQEFDNRVDERSHALAILLRDLGSGWRRNRKVWQGRQS